MTEVEQSFCLFDGDLGPMAVAVGSISAVVEAGSLVPLVWRPPQIVGLCAHHREVVPVIALGSVGYDADAVDARDLGTVAATSEVTPAAKDGSPEDRPCTVLILRSEHDSWGLRIEHGGTSISRKCPELHPPVIDERGAVLIGTLEGEGKRHMILDAEATWRGLRSAVVRWYRLINEPGFYAAIPLGDGARESGTHETG